MLKQQPQSGQALLLQRAVGAALAAAGRLSPACPKVRSCATQQPGLPVGFFVEIVSLIL